jgi:gliding motility-associated-like protein
MKDKLTKFWLGGLLIILFTPSFSQIQVCPNNINFSYSDITNWSAYTGLLDPLGSLGSRQIYPAPNTGISTISEYTISDPGINVITSSTTDLFGGFTTIPIINGYQYTNSVKLGSSANSHNLNSPGNPGGFVRGISYTINVPVGSTSVPYTMTYAYALVLENGTHQSDRQPQFKAVIIPDTGVPDSCASKKYSLPTNGVVDTNGTGATLDTATAIKQGFTNSNVAFFSYAGTSPAYPNGAYIYDIWTKGWSEVTFDLSPYRGQQVTLTFETDNCVPGVHFAYAYVALRNSCEGLLISGDTTVCSNSSWTYSIPALAGAAYKWTVPNNWKTTSDTSSNIIHIIAGSGKGYIVAKEQNSCANLTDSIEVTAIPQSVGGIVTGNNTVCTGSNTSTLLLNGNTGSVLKWLSSIDGITWDSVNDVTASYTAKNLTTTTLYKALVQNGQLCIPDTSSGVTILVDPKSVGGSLNPISTAVCQDQNKPAILTLTGINGIIFNWIYTQDNSTWQNFNPVKSDSTYSVIAATVPTQYRVIVKSGVCEPDTSSTAYIIIYPAKYPQATVHPLDTSICYGTIAPLTASVTQGSSYSWSNQTSLYDPGDGTISYIPYSINARVAPLKTSYYVLSVLNTGCPVLFTDTILIHVISPIIVHAGRDTSVVANQPLQLQASLSDTSGVYTWLWTPVKGLDNSLIANPVATFNSSIDSVRYVARATNTTGCYGEDDIVVHIFKTAPEIFVPSAFTPNGDGRNDILKPIPVGITKLDFFRVYNRWGQLIYSTSIIGNGWDGTLNGTQQPSGAYVYVVQGTDYKTNIIFRKGTVVLIR